MKTALIVIFLIISVLLTVIVMMQEGKGGGLVATNNSESYWGKNKGKSKEAVLHKITAVLGAAFIVLALLLSSKFI